MPDNLREGNAHTGVPSEYRDPPETEGSYEGMHGLHVSRLHGTDALHLGRSIGGSTAV